MDGNGTVRRNAAAAARPWWKDAVVYQVYPRSFQDADGDGIGDLKGLARRIPYLADLGVDALWVCPVYDSPNDDNGYDVRDYRAILPEFGTMADMDDVLGICRTHGIRVFMDLVANHTSDEHAWFLESRASKDSPKRDWYIWRKGRDGGPPDGLTSHFGGSAWEYDERTGESYFHLFSRRQPDLNWENPEVRAAIRDVMRFWLDRGVSGFRMDAITYLKKDWANAPADGPAAAMCLNKPGLLDFLREMKREALAPYGAATVAEAPGVPAERAMEFIDPDDGVFDLLFTFDHVDLDIAGVPRGQRRPWDLRTFKRGFTDWEKAAGERGWLALYLENHDQVRSVSKFGDDGRYRTESATMLAAWYLLMRGTPFVYQGQELGMANAPFRTIAEYRDVDALNLHREALAAGRSEAEVLRYLAVRGRDHSRTPMQWSGAPNAGFTDGTPWIAANPDCLTVNAEREAADPGSVLSFYKRLIRLRRTHPAFVDGTFEEILADSQALGGYLRTLGPARFAVVCNFTAASQPLPDLPALRGMRRVLGNARSGAPDALGPYETRVLGTAPTTD